MYCPEMMISCLAQFWWPFLPFIIALLTALRNTWRWFFYGEDVQCGDCWFIYWSRVTDDELAWGYWYSTSIYYYLIIVVKLVVDTGLSMTNWIYYSTFHLELMCGLFLVYRVDAISRTYGTIFFIFMSAIEDVMLPRLLYNKHISYAEQVNKRASYNLNNLSRDNRLFRTKIDLWVNHC